MVRSFTSQGISFYLIAGHLLAQYEEMLYVNIVAISSVQLGASLNLYKQGGMISLFTQRIF